MHQQNGAWILQLELLEGVHDYKYIVDGEWLCDMQKETRTDDKGNVNNSVIISNSSEYIETSDIYVPRYILNYYHSICNAKNASFYLSRNEDTFCILRDLKS